jgi:hypothetical protein
MEKSHSKFWSTLLTGFLIAILLPSWEMAYASPVQVLECSILRTDGALPAEHVDLRFTIRRHIVQVAPFEELTNDFWAQGLFEDNGYFDVTAYPILGKPITDRSSSTLTTIQDGKINFGDTYLDQALTMNKSVNVEGWTLESVAIIMRRSDGTLIDDHTVVPEVIDRDAWDPYPGCTEVSCPVECAVTWHTPGEGIECAIGQSGGGTGLCSTGTYMGRITSISYEAHEAEHGAGFVINAGLNDAWVNALAPYQGLFVTVYPDQGIVFVAWFTFDSELLPPGATAAFGAPDQRWVTAVGPYSGNRAELNAELTTGGVFNASEPVPVQDTGFGSMVLEFSDCGNGTLTYDFPSLGLSGEFAIERVEPGNATLCEALGAD